MSVNMKAMIAQTFRELAKTKKVDKITVKDVAEACHISRQTFYYHFQDILDVIEWSVQQVFQEILTHSMDAEFPEDTLRTLIGSFSEADALLYKLLHSQKREQIEMILVQTVRTFLKEMVLRRDPEPVLSPADAKTALDFCTYGIVGLLLENCGKAPPDNEKLARQMSRLISGRLGERKES